jgi:hypothetical protein
VSILTDGQQHATTRLFKKPRFRTHRPILHLPTKVNRNNLCETSLLMMSILAKILGFNKRAGIYQNSRKHERK